MPKLLIIAEKPSVARDIASALGGFQRSAEWLESPEAVVSSGIGHLVEIHSPAAEAAGWNLAALPVIPERFDLRPIDRTRTQYTLLSKLMKRADVDRIVNACDAGREGELIFQLIYDLAGCKKPVMRMWIQSMTEDSIREAFRTMRPAAERAGLANAAKCRNEADWLVGINGTRSVSKLMEAKTGKRGSTPVGRVQTPTLAIPVDRENEILNFVPKDYWEVHGTFGAAAGQYIGRWFNHAEKAVPGSEGAESADNVGTRINDKARADAVVARCRGQAVTAVKDDTTSTKSLAPKLFDLTTLQREANKRYKLSAANTLKIAQSLYEAKVTTYPRTDASALPEDYVATAQKVMGSLAGPAGGGVGVHAARVLQNAWIKPDKRIFDNSKISDHFAIIPTGASPSGLDADQAKIYDLIAKRFIAVFHPAAEFLQTRRITLVAGQPFRSSGKVLVKPGWLEVYGKDGGEAGETSSLARVVPGEVIKNLSIEAKGLKTAPPPRYTEATLLAAMEGAGKLIDDDELRDAMKDRGLGTPATRAATLEGLLDTAKGTKESYLTREGKAQHLVPTPKAMELIAFLRAHDMDVLTSPRLTGEWEQKLVEMEKGRVARPAFMAEIADMSRAIVDRIKREAATVPGIQLAAPKMLSLACPKCGQGQLAGDDRSVSCQAPKVCGFKLWRTICGRTLSEEEVGTLVTKGTLPTMAGFVSPKTGKAFSAGLKMDVKTGRSDFVFDERGSGGAAAAPRPTSAAGAPSRATGAVPGENSTLAAPCPKCGGTVTGDGRAYVCAAGDWRLWATIAGRPLAVQEAEALMRDGRLPTVSGLKSSVGKVFSAGLRLEGDRVAFDFGPR